MRAILTAPLTLIHEIMEEYKKLIIRYSDIKDKLDDYTKKYYDAMHYDIQGYIHYYDEADYRYVDDLKEQVAAFELILKGYKKLNYKF